MAACCLCSNTITRLYRSPTVIEFAIKRQLLRSSSIVSLPRSGVRFTRISSRPTNSLNELTKAKPQLLDALSLWKPLAFSIAFTGTAFAAAGVWQFERYNKFHELKLSRRITEWMKTPLWETGQETNEWTRLKQRIKREWSSVTDAQKFTACIVSVNLLVYSLWKMPSLAPFMMRNFTCSLKTTPLYRPMVLSMFSHFTLLHLGINMYVVSSFSEFLVPYLGLEQTTALYLSAGVFASFFSKAVKLMINSATPSVGASGAIMCLVAYSCVLSPDSKLALVFLPMFKIPAGYALTGLMCFDTLGVISRWRLLDHGGHLGGALFGLSHMYYGQEHLLKLRMEAIKRWKELRKSFGP